jgi:putative hydrolase of HD superfamily
MIPPQEHRDDSAVRGLLALARRAIALKAVPRTGWRDRGVAPAQVESVADHSFGVALLAWVCAVARRAQGSALDPQRVLALALLHDLAEAETGDVTPYDPVALSGQESDDARRSFLERRHIRDAGRETAKRTAEDAAMSRIVAMLPPAAAAALGDLWGELHAGTSAEARFVKEVDRLETFLQSRHYLRGDDSLPMGSFQQEVLETIDDPLLATIRDAALTDGARVEPG